MIDCDGSLFVVFVLLLCLVGFLWLASWCWVCLYYGCLTCYVWYFFRLLILSCVLLNVIVSGWVERDLGIYLFGAI